MSRLNTFVIIAITIAAAIWSRRLAIQLLAPGTAMYELAANATMFGGEQLADDIYRAVVVWVPWFVVVGAILGGLYREFWQTQVTARRVR